MTNKSKVLDEIDAMQPRPGQPSDPLVSLSHLKSSEPGSDASDQADPDTVLPLKGLSASEKFELAELETMVRRGKETFCIVGCALRRIRDSRLFRDEFENFQEYLWKRWRLGKSQGYRLIQASEFQEEVSKIARLSTEGAVRFPSEERAVRKLLELPDRTQQLDTLREASLIAGEEEICTKHIRLALDKQGYLGAVKKVEPKCAGSLSTRHAKLFDQIRAALDSNASKTELLKIVAALERSLSRKVVKADPEAK